MLRASFISTAAIAVFAATAASAVTITEWNFNSVPADGNTGTGISTPSIGSGSIAPVGGATHPGFNSGSGSSDTATSDNSGYQTETYAPQSTGSGTRGIQINAGTTGFEDIVLSFDIRTSNTSSRWYQINYSVDGNTFTPFGTPTRLGITANAGDTWHNGNSIDLSSIAGLNDNPNAAFQIVSVFSPDAFIEVQSGNSYGANSAYEVARNNGSSSYVGGTWRFDMVTISGTVVPEPASLAVLGLGSMLGLRRRRR